MSIWKAKWNSSVLRKLPGVDRPGVTLLLTVVFWRCRAGLGMVMSGCWRTFEFGRMVFYRNVLQKLVAPLSLPKADETWAFRSRVVPLPANSGGGRTRLARVPFSFHATKGALSVVVIAATAGSGPSVSKILRRN